MRQSYRGQNNNSQDTSERGFSRGSRGDAYSRQDSNHFNQNSASSSYNEPSPRRGQWDSAGGYENSEYGRQSFGEAGFSGGGFSGGDRDAGRRERGYSNQDNNPSGRSSFGSDLGTGFGQGEFGGGLTSRGHSGKGPKGYKRSDERVREDVCDALEQDHLVDASDIEITVKDGTVTLTGTVESRQAKRQAEECLDHVRGVRDVANQLQVQASQSQAGTRYGGTERDEDARGNGKTRKQ